MLKAFPEKKPQVPYASAIISFWNLLVHAYASVSHEVVWGILEGSLPVLLSQVSRLLDVSSGESA